jgi:streptogramin lyase
MARFGFTLPPNKIGWITTPAAITQYRVPGRNNMPWYITAGPDGAMWFTQFDGHAIGRITTDGVITKFPLPSPSSDAIEITSGPDGALWFTESHANQIGRITTAGVLTEYPLPGGYAYEAPAGITAGPDGALWFTAACCAVIERITTTGAVSYYLVEGFKTGGSAITTGPDGGLWFTTNGGVPQSVYSPRFLLGVGQTSGKLGAASFSVTARLYLEPYYGPPGSTASVIGYGCGPFETINIFWDSGSTALGSVTADAHGSFKGSAAFTFTISANAAPGSNTVTATGIYLVLNCIN